MPAALIVTLSQRLEPIEVNVLVSVIEHELGAAAAVALCEEDTEAENGQILQLREVENWSRRHTVRLDCKIIYEKPRKSLTIFFHKLHHGIVENDAVGSYGE